MSRVDDLRARVAKGRSRRTPFRPRTSAFTPTLPGSVDFQSSYDTQAQRSAANAQSNLNDAQQDAARALLRDSQQPYLTDDARKELQQIAAGDVQQEGRLEKTLELLDTPGALVRAALADVFGADTQAGVEITGETYKDILFQRDDKVREDLPVELVGEDGRISGSKLLELVGYDEAESLPGKITRGIAAFGVEVLTDPLSYVTFGTAGLGKKVASEAASATLQRFSKEGMELLLSKGLKANVDELADPLSRKLAKEAAQQADETIEGLVKKQLDDAIAEVSQDLGSPVGTAMADAQESLIRDQVKELEPNIIRSAMGDVTTREEGAILKLINSKQFKTLRQNHPEYVAAGPKWTSGGVKVTTPFGRRALDSSVDLGFANDVNLIAKGRKGFEKVLPESVMKQWDSVAKRLGTERAVAALDVAGEGAHLRNAYRYAAEQTLATNKILRDALPLSEIDAATVSLDNVHHLLRNRLAAAHAAVDADDAMSWVDFKGAMTTALELGSVEPVLANVSSAATREAITSSFTFLETMFSTLRDIAVDAGIEMGERARYVPTVPTNDFTSLINTFIDSGVEVVTEGIEDDTLRHGLELVSEYMAASGRTANSTGLPSPSFVPFAQRRQFADGVVMPLGAEGGMALDAGRFSGLLTAPQRQSIPKHIVNERIKVALDHLLTKQGKRPLDEAFEAFDTDIERVLDVYTTSLADATTYAWMVKGAQGEGLINPAKFEIDRHLTVAQLTNSYTKEHESALFETFRILRGKQAQVDRLEFTTKPLRVGKVSVDVPAVLADDPQTKKLLTSYSRAMKRASDKKRSIQAEVESTVRSLKRQGIDEDMARSMAYSTHAGEVEVLRRDLLTRARTTEAFLTQQIDSAVVKSVGIAKDDIDFARREVRKIIKATDAVIAEAEAQWRRTVGVQEIPPRTINLLSEAAGDGTTVSPLRVLAGVIKEQQPSDTIPWSLVSPLTDTGRDLFEDVGRSRSAFLSAINGGAYDAAFAEARKQEFLTAFRAAGVDVTDIRDLPATNLHSGFFSEQMWAKVDDTLELDSPAALEAWLSHEKASAHHVATSSSTSDRLIQAIEDGNINYLYSHQAELRKALEPFGLHSVVIDPHAQTMVASLGEAAQTVSFDTVLKELREVFGRTIKSPQDLYSHAYGNQADLSDDVVEFMARVGPTLPPESARIQRLHSTVANLRAQRSALNKAYGSAKREDRAFVEFEAAWASLSKQLDKAASGQGTAHLVRNFEQHRKLFKRFLDEDGSFAQLNDLVQQFEAVRLGQVKKSVLKQNAVLADGTIYTPVKEAHAKLERHMDETVEAIKAAATQELREQLDEVERFEKLMYGMWGQSMAQDLQTGVISLAPNHTQYADDIFKAQFTELREAAQAVGTTMGKLARERGQVANRKHLAQAKKAFGFDSNWNLAVKEVVADYGYVPAQSFGVGGELANQVIEPNMALIFENIAANTRAMYTPEGIRMLGENARQLQTWWKGAATVARPTFVPRNILGITQNNMIIGVGARDYAFVGTHAATFRKALRNNATLGEALQALPDKVQPYFEWAYRSGLLKTNFSEDLSHLDLDRVAKGLSLDSLKPWKSDDFLAFRVGGRFMEQSEDFGRMAAFVRHFDPDNAEATAEFAKSMALAVHFDYGDLTKFERKIKTLVPFFVWTRRNIPLQLRVMMERPGLINRYTHLMNSMDDQFPDTELDLLPDSQYSSGMQIETDILFGEGTDFVSRLIIDPDLPLTDLEAVLNLNPIPDAGWMKTVFELMGPAFTLPVAIMEKEDWNDVNAPAGLHSIIRTLDSIGLYDGKVSEEGDVLISRGSREVFETALPFFDETVGTLVPTDPKRKAALGISPEGGADERLRAILLRLARAGGGQLQTPTSSSGASFEAQRRIDEILEEARVSGALQPDQ